MKQISLNWIDPYACNKFSDLKNLDLQDLIVNIENFYLIYRDTLGLPEKVTFGTEIEYEKLSMSKVSDFLNDNMSDWESKRDGSVNSGGEINSAVLTDTKGNWQKLASVCKFLRANKAYTSGNAGGHIHIGAHILGNDFQNWQNFLYLYATYEHILFRFLYGDKINARHGIKDYAQPIRNELLAALNEDVSRRIKNIIHKSSLSDKHQAINFLHVQDDIGLYMYDNTIEFRFPNSSTEEIIWQNNINALTKTLLVSKNNNFDLDYVKYQIKSQGDIGKYHYNEVCLKDALEFVDIVFDNNLDKVYFLRQYFKNLEPYFNRKETMLARRFIV